MDDSSEEERSRSASRSKSKSPPREHDDDILMDSDDDQTEADRLKKITAGEDVVESVSVSVDIVQSDEHPQHRAEHGTNSGVGIAPPARRDGSGEVAHNPESDGNIAALGGHRRDSSSHSSASSSSSFIGSSGRDNKSASNDNANNNRSSRKDDSRSRSRSPSVSSRSDSRSGNERPRPPSPSLYERLKTDPNWGKEDWQDFELLQSNVPGPGHKDSGGGGPSRQGGADSDMEMEDSECSCVPINGPNGPTCFDNSCHNHATMQECAEGRCHPGCRNQRIQRRENAKVEVFNAEGKGMGLKLLAPVKKGDFIMEYVGEIISRKELNKRMLSSAGTRKLYMMQLGDTTYLDAKRKGGIARFVNHACEPTCRLEQWTALGQPRCAVFSLRDMDAGEELSFDYQWEAHELRQNTKCLCGTPSCRGTIEVLNPNGDTGGGPFARRARASAMGVWRTPKEKEYADPEGLVGRKVRVYFDGDCTFFEAKVMRYKQESKTHMLLYAGEGESVADELEEDLIGVQGKIQGIDKWQIWEESDRVVNIKKKDPTANESNGTPAAAAAAAAPNVTLSHAGRSVPSRFNGMAANGGGRHFAGRFAVRAPPSMYPDMVGISGMGFQPGMPSTGFGGMIAGPPLPVRAPPPPPPPPLPPAPVGPRVAENFCVTEKEAPKLQDASETVNRIRSRTGVSIELLESEDPRAALCPGGQRLLRVAGGRDQVNMAVDMLRVQQLSMLPLEGWITAERKRKAQEEADTKELEAAAKAQVGRPRQRWCIGSDWHCFSKSVVTVLAANKVVSDLRRNALHVVRQVAESGAGKSSVPSPLAFHACVLLHRYLAIVNTTPPDDPSTSSDPSTPDRDTENGTKSSNRTSKTTGSNANGIGNGSTSNGAGAGGGGSGGGGATGSGRPFRMETNFYVLATACLLLANKSLRARVGSARPRRREELLRAAYGVQFRGRTVEKGTAEAAKWEAKLAAAELEVLAALGFDLHLTDPLEALDSQRGQQFISDAIHEKARSLLVESVTQGCTAWLRFEPDVVALSILLLAIARAESREELINRARTLAVNAGSTWPSVLACTQGLSRSLPSMVGGGGEGGEEVADGAAAALRENVPTPDPLQYPEYEPPLVAAQTRLRQRRRAEDAVGDAQLRTTAFLMMRKAQDRAGLHGGLDGLQGLKGLAGFGSTLASNKFVRAAIREEDLIAGGLACLLPSLESWKGFTVGGPLAGANGAGRNVEVYLQRWPADKKDDVGCGLSSSGVSELALFQELHSYSSIPNGHSTLLVPLAVVVGAGVRPTANKVGGQGSKPTSFSKSNAGTAESGISQESAMTVGMDPLGMAGVPMGLGSSHGLGDIDAVGGIGASAGEGEGEQNGASQIPEELLRPSYLLLEPVRYTLAEILRLCRRPMVLPGPLVRSLLQDLLGAVALCHDRNVVIKALDAEKVYLNGHGGLKLGCLAQAMMVAPKNDAPTDGTSSAKGGAVDDNLEDVDMEVEETAAGRKAAHREVKLRLKQEKLARENACKKAVASFVKEGEPAKTVLWGMAPEVLVDQKHPYGPATDIWAVGCLAAQLALGKPIFGGRTRAQQLEYVFKCCGSPGQGRWPEGNKAPLYRHLRPVDKDGKSLHFKPRLAKVLSAEGSKGVPLDPELCELLQGLLKLDARHRIGARGALASPYFAPHPGAPEERYDAWMTLRGDLDKVQMGVATPDQLRGTYAAANAPTGHPLPPGSRGLVGPSASLSPPPPPPRENGDKQDRNERGDGGRAQHGHNSSRGERERMERLAHQGETSRGEWQGDGDNESPPPPPPPRSGGPQAIELPLQVVAPVTHAFEANNAADAGRDSKVDRVRGGGGRNRSGSRSPRGGSRRRSPTNGRSRVTGQRDNQRDRERERDEREKDRKRKRDRERGRDTYGDRRAEQSGKDQRWSSRGHRGDSGRSDYHRS